MSFVHPVTPSPGRGTIITQLLGGLGNQMFQYAVGRRLANEHSRELKVDPSILLEHSPGRHLVNRTYDLDIFALQVGVATERERRRYNPCGLSMAGKLQFRIRNLILGSGAYVEKSFRYDEHLMGLTTPPPYLAGMWQSYKYVDPIRECLLRDFAFRDPLPLEAADLAELLRAPSSICVNVRRTDFVTVAANASLLGFIGTDYYRKAAEFMRSRLGDSARYFVFSDDLEWCREELAWLPNKPVFVGHDLAGPKFSQYLHLMTLARHFVIPNSTFGWWAAWLSESADKTVVAPRQWFRDLRLNSTDLCPPDWTLL
jgi:hypothetical protein